jgi:N-acetylglucosamine-6-phosphate deacetylase
VSVEESLPGARVVVHGARKCDVDGEADGFWVVFDGDRIAATGNGAGWAAHAGAGTDVVDAAGAVLTPGFIDLHGHGGGGFSFDDGADAIGRALAVHRARDDPLGAEPRREPGRGA